MGVEFDEMRDPVANLAGETIAEFCRRWSVVEFALFGSVLRSDFGPESDVDVLVTFGSGVLHGVDEHIAMRDELERIFERRVDLVPVTSLRNPFRRQDILSTRKVIYRAAA